VCAAEASHSLVSPSSISVCKRINEDFKIRWFSLVARKLPFLSGNAPYRFPAAAATFGDCTVHSRTASEESFPLTIKSSRKLLRYTSLSRAGKGKRGKRTCRLGHGDSVFVERRFTVNNSNRTVMYGPPSLTSRTWHTIFVTHSCQSVLFLWPMVNENAFLVFEWQPGRHQEPCASAAAYSWRESELRFRRHAPQTWCGINTWKMSTRILHIPDSCRI